MSRTGSSQELAMGPVHYGVCISLATLIFWKRVEVLYAILPIAIGDGISAFFGPSIRGNRPLWFNPNKTWFGLISFCVSTYCAIVVYVYVFTK